jgi:hypothetical protein
MAVAEQEQEQEQQQQEGRHGGVQSTAVKAAAAAAATGAATYAVRKLVSREGGSLPEPVDRAKRAVSGGKGSDLSSIVSSAGASAWDAASKALLPMAEEAADAAGKYLAEHAPDVVRERVVPKFIEAFNDAS